jgi:hypothetical protein
VHEGADTTVHRARHPRTHRPLVIKVPVGAEQAHSLRSAAALLGAADHPGILTVHDVREDGSLVLPEIGGGTLADLIGAHGPLDERATAQLVLALADGLDHLHRRSLAHGDLSASNVLLHLDGQPVLADPSPGGSSSGTSGTAAYAPPEVVAGAAASPSTDLYALGVIGLECLGAAGSPALRTALSAAAHPDPAQRIATARLLAGAVSRAVPGTTWLDRAAPRPAAAARDRTVVEPATRAFGPPPPRPRPAAPTRPGRRVLRGLAALFAVVAAATTVVVAVRTGDAGTSCGSTEVHASSRAADVEGDLDGDGCEEAVRWDAASAVAELPTGRRIQVGEAGDLLLLGDWDCDDTDTPALYRPSTGEVFEFATWVSGADALTSSRTHKTGIRDGTPTVAHPTGAGCDHVAVEPPEG